MAPTQCTDSPLSSYLEANLSAGRIALFLTVVLSIWAAVHGYVFWRLSSIPWLAAHVSRRVVLLAAVVLWASYPLARILEGQGMGVVAGPLEFLGANWIGVAFLLLCALLVTEVVTLGGFLLPRIAPALRGWAAMTALLLAVVGLVQGLRPPVVREDEVRLAGLPPERDGMVLVVISDLHLGTMIGAQWLTPLVARLNELHPDLVLAVGDVVDGNVGKVEPLVPLLRKLHAPMGVWAVTGNHEYYAGVDRSVALFEAAGMSVLRDRWAQPIPGLILAGVDDLTARLRSGQRGQPLEKALAGRPLGATILLSHSPLQTDLAAAAGAGLMLSGHTHNGQLWPFNYLVAQRYPLLCGRYQVGGMTVMVSRGTGTWGPRMRLWQPAEILRLTLRSAAKNPTK
jgi:uncharacterized protein